MKTKILVVMVLVIAGFTSCLKDPGIEEIGMRLRFVHASPDAGSIDIKLNDQDAFATPLSFADTTAYTQFKGATYNVALNEAGKEKLNSVVDFVPGKSYTLIALDSAKHIKLSIVKDEIVLPSQPLRTRLRFFNTSADAGTLALVGINASDTTIFFRSRLFNEQASTPSVASFTEFKSNEYQLLLVSGNNVVATVPSVTFVNDKTYTIYTRGFLSGTGNQAIALSVLPHN